MKKILIPVFGLALGVFGVAAIATANASEPTLQSTQCNLKSGDWFCFYHNGIAYYSKCTTTYPEPTTCGGGASRSAKKDVEVTTEAPR